VGSDCLCITVPFKGPTFHLPDQCFPTFFPLTNPKIIFCTQAAPIYENDKRPEKVDSWEPFHGHQSPIKLNEHRQENLIQSETKKHLETNGGHSSTVKGWTRTTIFHGIFRIFFCSISRFLFIYSIISHRTPHDVLHNCIWETLSQIINECGTLAVQ
jgi:hypothetical protein